MSSLQAATNSRKETSLEITKSSCFDDLVSILEWIQDDNPELEFKIVPCKSSGEARDMRKIPCLSNWQKGITAQEFRSSFSHATMLAILPGDQFVILDMDSQETSEWLKTVFEANKYDWDGTLRTYKANTGRGAIWFRIPENINISYFAYVVKDQDISLEIRTGSNYQVVAGIHPDGYPYLNNDVFQIAELPGFLVREIENWNQSAYALHHKDVPKDSSGATYEPEDFAEVTEDDFRHLIQWLLSYDSPELDNSEPKWFQLGAIVNFHFPGEDGYDLWCELSHMMDGHHGEDKFEECRQRSRWDSFSSSSRVGNCKTIASYYAEAQTIVEKLSGGSIAPARGTDDDYLPDGKKVALGEVIANVLAHGKDVVAKAKKAASARAIEAQGDYVSWRMRIDQWVTENLNNPEAQRLKEVFVPCLVSEYKVREGDVWDYIEDKIQFLKYFDYYQGLFQETPKVQSSDLAELWEVIDPSGIIARAGDELGFYNYALMETYLTVVSGLMPKGRVFHLTGSYYNSTSKFFFLVGRTSEGKGLHMKFFSDTLAKYREEIVNGRNEKLKKYKQIRKDLSNIDSAHQDEVMAWIKGQNIDIENDTDYGKGSKHQPPTVLVEQVPGDAAVKMDDILGVNQFDPKKEALPYFKQKWKGRICEEDLICPVTRKIMINNATLQRLTALSGCQRFPFLVTFDELHEFERVFKPSIQSRNGEFDLLAGAFDGKDYDHNQVGNREDNEDNPQEEIIGTHHFSMIACVQPDVYRSNMDITDDNGIPARFNYIDLAGFKPNNLGDYSEESIAKNDRIARDKDDHLRKLYRALDSWRSTRAESTFETSPAAVLLWRQFQGELEAIALDLERKGQKGFANWILKLAHKAVKDANNIHCLRVIYHKTELLPGHTDAFPGFSEGTVDYVSMSLGIKLARIHLRQHKAVFSLLQPPTEDLDGELQEVHKYLVKRGENGASVRQVSTTYYAKKNKLSTSKVQELLKKLAALGKAEERNMLWYAV